MASSQGFFSAFPTSKRSACDRCRVQKLRCLPRDRDAESCSRCVRLSARCTTTYPRPAGRPPNGSKALGPEQPSLTVFQATQNPPSSASPGMARTSQPTNTVTANDSFPSSTSEDSLDIWSFRHTGSDNFIMFDSSNNEETGGLNYHDMVDPAFHALPALPDVGSTDSNIAAEDPRTAAKDPVDASFEDTRRLNDGLAAPEHSSHVLGCDRRLFNLNLDLSKQVQRYLTVTRPHDSPMMDITSSHSPSEADSGLEGNLRSNLLSDALSGTSEFLAIIQSYRMQRRDSSSSNDSIPSTRPRLGLIAFLNLLSVFLELVVIYEKLFQSLSNQLFDASSVRFVDGLQGSLPGLQLTDFSIQQGNLQTKILIHAILHQFEMIERILGLPAEFRVTEKQDDYSGLFEEGWARELLEVMSNGILKHAAVENHCGLEALSSLREMLQKVQTCLKI